MESTQPTWQEFVESWEIFRDPILSGGIAGAVLGFLGVYIVLRRMVFVSAAVTQGAGMGVALAFYAGIHWGWHIDPGIGAVIISLVVAGILVPDPRRTGLSREVVLGLVFAVTGASAILIGSRITQEAHDIQAILFGTAVLVTPEDLRDLMIASGLVIALHLWWFRGLVFASFDPISARVHGLPVRLLDAVLLISIGVMVGVSARALGALPVFALSTMPAAAAILLSRGSLLAAFPIAALLGATAGVGGYMIAFFREFPVGSTQAALAAALVVLALVIKLALWALRSTLGARP